jgi:nucleoside-diphosphate-sugar epimerase
MAGNGSDRPVRDALTAPALVALTGADGFIGRHLCARWAEAGRPLLAITRTPAAATVDAALPMRREACGDLAEAGPARLASLLRGADAVVHLAGRAHVMRETAGDPAAAYARANVEATRRIAQAAAEAGVRRFVFASTVKVHGDVSPSGRPFSERDPPDPRDDYARSKRAAECVLAEFARDTAMTVVVLRLPLVYGPGVSGNFARLLDAVRSGIPLPVGAVANRRSLLYVGNLRSAIEAVLDHPATLTGGVRTWLVADALPVATPALVRELAGALDVAPRMPSVPLPLLRLAARMAGKTAAYDRLAGSLEVDTAAIRDAIGWTAPCPFAEGIAATVRGDALRGA